MPSALLLSLLVLGASAFGQPSANSLPGKVASLNDRIRGAALSGSILADRAAAMRELMRQDPARALELALPDDTLAALRQAFPDQAG